MGLPLVPLDHVQSAQFETAEEFMLAAFVVVRVALYVFITNQRI